MAKITAPFLALGASGTIGKTLTAATWRGRPYLRQRVIPSNPQTAGQTSTRNAFSFANQVWKLAGTLLVAPWDRFADGQVLTGRNRFQGTYVADNRGLGNLAAFQFSIGAKGGIPPTGIVVTPGVGQLTVDITEPAIPTGWTLQAAIAGAIEDQDPETGILYTTTVDEDLATPFQVVLTGLNTNLYRVGAWLRWAKPDGSIAYSASVAGQGTPT